MVAFVPSIIVNELVLPLIAVPSYVTTPLPIASINKLYVGDSSIISLKLVVHPEIS